MLNNYFTSANSLKLIVPLLSESKKEKTYSASYSVKSSFIYLHISLNSSKLKPSL